MLFETDAQKEPERKIGFLMDEKISLCVIIHKKLSVNK